MTEEEKSTNQKAEEAEAQENEEVEEVEEVEDTTFDVVMPEANRVVMDAEEIKKQPEYLETFANFYIAHFDQQDLEIMNLYDKGHNMIDINKYLLNNINFPRKTLMEHALQTHDHNFNNLLDEIAKDDVNVENMVTFEDWDNWYEKRRREIPGSLS